MSNAHYYAVIFTSQRREGDDDYGAWAARMDELAATMPGYLGQETTRQPDGLGVSVSYWASEDAIAHWRKNAEHLEAQERGRSTWYHWYRVRVARIEREYSFER